MILMGCGLGGPSAGCTLPPFDVAPVSGILPAGPTQ